MEMHPFERHPVSHRFRERDLAEDRAREFTLFRSDRGPCQNRFNIGQKPIIFFVFRVDGHLRGGEPAALHFLDFQLDRQVQRRERSANRGRIDARVDHGTENHVATDSAKTVEMYGSHRSSSEAIPKP